MRLGFSELATQSCLEAVADVRMAQPTLVTLVVVVLAGVAGRGAGAGVGCCGRRQFQHLPSL